MNSTCVPATVRSDSPSAVVRERLDEPRRETIHHRPWGIGDEARSRVIRDRKRTIALRQMRAAA